MQSTIESSVSHGTRVAELARVHPDEAAIVFAPQEGEEQSMTWKELDSGSNRAARVLQSAGVADGSRVVIGLPNHPSHYLAALATWKLGATAIPISWRLPEAERAKLLELAEPASVVSPTRDQNWKTLSGEDLYNESFSSDPLPDKVSNPGIAIATGGSTGRPKLVIPRGAWARSTHSFLDVYSGLSGVQLNQVQLVAGPLYHGAPFSWGHFGLFLNHKLILMEKFEAAHALRLIERHRVNFAFMVPTMMARMLRSPDVGDRDLSSLQAVFHAGGACPIWVKRGWIELIGAERIYEGFGSSEGVGMVRIRGDEWLEHPGSVGRPFKTELRILTEDGEEAPTGEVGEIFMRPEGQTESPFEYIGSQPPKATEDGLVGVGDLGWLDHDGYLFIADRRIDMIVTGGANVYPAEVEGALLEHPKVKDVVVVGIPDVEWGRRVHAIVQPSDRADPPDLDDLDGFVRSRLVSYKLPKSYEFLDDFPRNEMGKIRRSVLAEERSKDEVSD